MDKTGCDELFLTAEFCAAEEGIPSIVSTFEMTRQLYSYNTVKFLYTRLFVLGILEHGVECNTRSLPLDFTALEKMHCLCFMQWSAILRFHNSSQSFLNSGIIR